MAGEIENLTTKVEESVTVQESAITLLGNLSDLIRAAANDPVKLNALADSLESEKTIGWPCVETGSKVIKLAFSKEK